MRRAGLLAVAALVLAGCGGTGGGRGPSVPTSDLLGEWELYDGGSGDLTVSRPAGRSATITFADGQATGTSFCNHYFGSYRASGTSLSFDGLGTTDMACTDAGVMPAEAGYLRALGAVHTATVEDGDLLLTGNGTALRFRRVPAVPAAELVGTRWVLDTLVQGEVASSTLGEPAVLLLTADGAFTGSTGCRTLTGRWARPDGNLAFPELRAGGDCPSDVRTQDEHVLAVLHAEVSAAVDGDRLTITSRDGLGLVYLATRR
jgi:heat shock protein HslJ